MNWIAPNEKGCLLQRIAKRIAAVSIAGGKAQPCVVLPYVIAVGPAVQRHFLGLPGIETHHHPPASVCFQLYIQKSIPLPARRKKALHDARLQR